MLSLAELRRCARVIDTQFAGHRLEKVVQAGDDRIVLTLYGRGSRDDEKGAKRHLLVSGAPDLARVSELSASPPAPDKPPAFASYLRAHVSRARLEGARLRGEDRQLVLRFEAREGRFDLLLSLLGKRSNLYVLGGDGTLRAALRPLEKTRRALSVGAAWEDPPAPPGGSREGEDRFAETSDDELLVAIQAEYATREKDGESARLAQQLATALRKERKQADRRLERIEGELAEADQAPVLQREGELLKSVLGRIRPGDSEVEARDYESGAEVTIPLDPKKSPKENLEATFKRYQKLVRRLAKAGGQVDDARAQCAALRALEAEVSALGEVEDDGGRDALEALAARPEVVRLLGKRAARLPAVRAKKPELPAALRGIPRKLVPRRYRSVEDFEIWVGRSDEGNDHLTMRLARGKDLFFHVDGSPGTHVILRTGGRSDPPSEAVLDACELAANFSKMKNANRCDIHVVPIKNVKKPKGAKAGLVYVTGGKSIHLRREEARLAKILAARIED